MPGRSPLEDVIATAELERRPRRTPDAEAEARAMSELQYALAGSPTALLQKLAEKALELCRAHSAGVSLTEEADGRRFFRWYAVAGRFSGLRWTTLPHELSPCAEVLARRETVLMVDPERHYGQLPGAQPHVTEVLLVPFSVGGELVGTVWVVAHDEERRFDAEDRRVVTELTQFASAGYGRLQSLRPEDVRELSRMHLAAQEPRNSDSP
jgi:GAF domain-containing protein